MGRDHLADQQVFHSGLGAEVFVDEGEQLVEFFARLAGKHDGSGEEAVTHGVLRGTGFAFGRFGSAGAGSVGSGCGFLLFGSHIVTEMCR